MTSSVDIRAERTPGSLRRGPIGWIEPALILAVALVGPLFYAVHLGFYTDDWAFLADLKQSPDQSIGGLYTALTRASNVADRPLQALLYIAYHKIAPDSAIVPQIINQLMFLSAMLALHSGLRKLPALRCAAYHVVLVYACLPHYFTERLWYANHQSTLSMLLVAIALHLAIAVRARALRTRLPWLAALFLCSLASLLAYEVFGMLLLAMPWFVACAEGRRWREWLRDGALIQSTAAILAALIAASAFKMMVAQGLFPPMTLQEHVSRTVELYRALTYTNFWTLGIKAPRIAWKVAHGPYFDARAIGAAAIVVAILVIGEGLRARRADGRSPADAKPTLLILAGIAAFILGYVPFLANFLYGDSPFGIDNRGNVAAALGVAFMAAGAVRWLWAWSSLAARVGIIAICAIGIFLQVTVGIVWGQAWDVQQQAYGQLLKALPRPSSNESVLLYGLCPYYGPAPVFADSWGLVDRLHLDRGPRVTHADTITPYSQVRPDGLMTMSDWMPGTLLRYSGMKIFDVRANRLTAIDSYGEAQAFFASHPIDQATRCAADDYNGVSLYWQ